MPEHLNLYHVIGTVEDQRTNEKKNPVVLTVTTKHSFEKTDGSQGERTVTHKVKCWGAHGAAAAGLRKGDTVEAQGEMRNEVNEVGEGDAAKKYHDHFLVVDGKNGKVARL